MTDAAIFIIPEVAWAYGIKVALVILLVVLGLSFSVWIERRRP